MASLQSMDSMYMDICKRIAEQSRAVRKKVGCVISNDNNIISYGWNGTPSGDDNVCEYVDDNGNLVTKPEVLHAESNALMKLLASKHPSSANGASLYVTMSPCVDCAKLIFQAGITRVRYFERYRDDSGIAFLSGRGIDIEQHDSV